MNSESIETEDRPEELAPTLSEVAKRAGVSSITVSRVLRTPDRVAPDTRARIEKIMREVGYVPNLVAGALASAKTNSVGVLVPTIANSIFADTVQGLSETLEPRGFSVILAQSRYDDAREDRMLAALLSRRPEAIIMVGSPATEDGNRLLRHARIPIVETWELPPNPIDAVAGFDNYQAGVAVARHLRLAAAAAAGPRSQCRRQRRGACQPAGRRCGVCRQRCPCDRLHVGLARRRPVARRAGIRATGGAGRPRRSRDGAADLADAFHHQCAWRCDRPYCGDADAGARRRTPHRSRLRIGAARKRLARYVDTAAFRRGDCS
ncbi:MAG: LacI family transcriptional regulator [Bradyrhizobium icense]|nr:MAG: LacI family transcriptional regulator [Bradyrhizobium icense]